MAKSTVYRSFEVREGFGPSEVGELVFSSEDRGAADHAVEDLSAHGHCAQLFGVRSEAATDRVLLRNLVGLKAA
jgi:hypothetical protein